MELRADAVLASSGPKPYAAGGRETATARVIDFGRTVGFPDVLAADPRTADVATTFVVLATFAER